jgi:exonuclease III
MGRFYICVTLQDLKLQKLWKLVLVYGAAQDTDKEDFLVELGDVCCNQKLPMLIGGDFNILRFPSDKNKAMRKNKWSDLFNAIINTYELREIEMSGGQFTWSNNQAIPTLEKLDRFLMTTDWEKMFPLVTVHKISREVSDHNPIILDTLEDREQISRSFKFEKSWLKEDGFLEKVDEIWRQPVHAKNSLEIVQIKLKKVKNI